MRRVCGESEAMTTETDVEFVQRVYPQHGWAPSEGTYEQFCADIRARHEREHRDLAGRLDALRAAVAAMLELPAFAPEREEFVAGEQGRIGYVEALDAIEAVKRALARSEEE